MKFKEPHLELEFSEALNPTVRELEEDFDAWAQEQGLPEVVVTHVLRTKGQSRTFYLKYAGDLIGKLKTGQAMGAPDRELAVHLSTLTEDQMGTWAENKPSWHKSALAVDQRNTQYSANQLTAVMAYLKRATQEKGGAWEVLSHDVSNGSHIHVGLKDLEWAAAYHAKFQGGVS